MMAVLLRTYLCQRENRPRKKRVQETGTEGIPLRKRKNRGVASMGSKVLNNKVRTKDGKAAILNTLGSVISEESPRSGITFRR